MVLKSLLGLVFLLSFSACMPTQKPLLTMPQPTPISLALIRESTRDSKVSPLPTELHARLVQALSARQFQPKDRSSELLDDFQTVRDSLRRMALIQTQGLGLLIETKALFYSQISGRYRWTVYVKFTLVDPNDPASPWIQSFEYPAVLKYAHQDEDDAVQSVAQEITRQLGKLLDRYIQGRKKKQALKPMTFMSFTSFF